MRCFLEGAKCTCKELEILESQKGELYFQADEELVQYSGSMYGAMDDRCYYDENNNIICIGNPVQEGVTVEFVKNTYAVINQNNLTAIFMKIDGLEDKIVVRKGMMHAKKGWQLNSGQQESCGNGI